MDAREYVTAVLEARAEWLDMDEPLKRDIFWFIKTLIDHPGDDRVIERSAMFKRLHKDFDSLMTSAKAVELRRRYAIEREIQRHRQIVYNGVHNTRRT
jgi:hypothetical protein